MALITREYNEDLLVESLKRLNPEVNFGANSRVTEVDADHLTSNGRPTLTVQVSFYMTREELAAILDASAV